MSIWLQTTENYKMWIIPELSAQPLELVVVTEIAARTDESEEKTQNTIGKGISSVVMVLGTCFDVEVFRSKCMLSFS